MLQLTPEKHNLIKFQELQNQTQSNVESTKEE